MEFKNYSITSSKVKLKQHKMPTLLEKASNWLPDSDDAYGDDKLKFLKFLIDNCQGYNNAMAIKALLKKSKLSRKFSKEKAQHNLIVPLREVPELFIGTSRRGIFLIVNPTDAHVTMTFYRQRIQSERKHQMSLKKLIDNNNLYLDFKAEFPSKERTRIYFDESGNPDLAYIQSGKYFIVTAFIVSAKNPEKELEIRLDSIRKFLNKKVNYELKSNKLNYKEFTIVLKEISLLDYQVAVLVIDKSMLHGPKFEDPQHLYKYAFKLLIERVLINLPLVEIYYDQYGSRNSKFQKEFFNYIVKNRKSYPSNQILSQHLLESANNNFIQIADIFCGIVHQKMKGNNKLYSQVQDRFIEYIEFPY